MIVRDYLACVTCETPHMVRVQVGLNSSQPHAFNCLNCNEPIKLKLETNLEKASAKVVPVENCERISPVECTPVYLCTDFIASRSEINEEMSFPSFQFSKDVSKNLPSLKDLIRNGSDVKHFDPQGEWASIQKIWRLEVAGKHSVAKPFIEEYATTHRITEKNFQAILHSHLSTIFPLPGELRNELKDIIKNHKSEFVNFLYFYKLELKALHKKSLFNLMSDFYSAYEQHSQVLPYIRFNKSLPKDAKATLFDFEKVKAFYASAYEYFASAIVIYTCLNNIKASRKYNQLKNITLKKYLETDKAKRRDSIIENPLFSSLTSEFDSNIRNASFHNWFFVLPDNETIELRSGGTGELKKITYTNYLLHCCRMYRQICQLYCFELELEEIANNLGVLTFAKTT